MTSYVENETKKSFDFDIKKLLDEIMEETLKREGCPYEVQVNLLVTDNMGIQELNRQYRQMDKPTDVLSFPAVNFEKEGDFSAAEKEGADCFDPDTGELLLGDIAVSADKVTEQAAEYGHSEKREFGFLLAHSILHLCGYDHRTKQEERTMEEKQEAVLAALGITRENT